MIQEALHDRHVVFVLVFTGGWLLFAAIAWFTVIRHEGKKK